ncbi:hypothetical protein [Qipengyuania flava]|uniref:hypothetical protein n=1 Tax=Qipengyuania flava TaxID=192812 RepID=UPI003219564E
MSPTYALSVWRSIRTTFVLFLVVVPLVILANGRGDDDLGASWSELVVPALGLIAFAGLFAELCRRAINHFAGEAICHWSSRA